MVLTVYRALYRDESTIQKSKFSLLATGLYYMVLSCMCWEDLSVRESNHHKERRDPEWSSHPVHIEQFKLWAGKLQMYCIVYVLYTTFRGYTGISFI